MIRKFQCDKLIRDKLVDSLTQKGIKLIKKDITDEETIIKYYAQKIVEEANEVLEASCGSVNSEKAKVIEELADLCEIITAFAKLSGISQEQIQAVQTQKANEKGAFENKVIIDRMEIDSENPVINYYLNNPSYPEIK